MEKFSEIRQLFRQLQHAFNLWCEPEHFEHLGPHSCPPCEPGHLFELDRRSLNSDFHWSRRQIREPVGQSRDRFDHFCDPERRGLGEDWRQGIRGKEEDAFGNC